MALLVVLASWLLSKKRITLGGVIRRGSAGAVTDSVLLADELLRVGGFSELSSFCDDMRVQTSKTLRL